MDLESIQYTNDEATASKAYAVRLGYWTDPYIKLFCPFPTPSTPEISRGYFVRVQTFEVVVSRFIQDCDRSCQVVNFGAGSDTLFFRLKDRGLLPKAYVELDLPGNVKKKIFILRRNKILQSALVAGDSSSSSPSITTDRASFGCYHLLSFDLQSDPESLIKLLCTSVDGPHLSTDLPTLFLAECVLVYIPTKSSNALLSTLSSRFSQAAFLNYEQVNMLDRFGEIMRSHFRDKSCELPGLDACGSLEDQIARVFDAQVFGHTLPLLPTNCDRIVACSARSILFKNVGWMEVRAWTINDVFSSLPTDAVKRISRVEMLDDTEITQQLYDHYCIVLASNTNSICNWDTLKTALEDLK